MNMCFLPDRCLFEFDARSNRSNEFDRLVLTNENNWNAKIKIKRQDVMRALLPRTAIELLLSFFQTRRAITTVA